MIQAIDMTTLVPLEGERLAQVIDAISNLTDADVLKGETAGALDVLSSSTVFDGIEPNPDGVFLVQGTDQFEATATIYVTLRYGGDRDGVTVGDAYPAYVSGHFAGVDVVIDDVSVDTGSFYE